MEQDPEKDSQPPTSSLNEAPNPEGLEKNGFDDSQGMPSNWPPQAPIDAKNVEAQVNESGVTSEGPKPIEVARADRRGLFGRFTLVAEVQEPKHYPRGTKWFITFVVALAAVAAPMGSAIFFRKESATPFFHSYANWHVI